MKFQVNHLQKSGSYNYLYNYKPIIQIVFCFSFDANYSKLFPFDLELTHLYRRRKKKN